MGGTKKETKKWEILDQRHRETFSFFPEFLINEEDGKVECRWVDIKIGDKTYKFNFIDLWMFFYFCGAEEQRKNLALIKERRVEYIPYDVSFKLKPEELKEPGQLIKRRIEVPIDQIQMFNIRQEQFGNPLAKIYRKIVGGDGVKTAPGVIRK